MKRYMIEDKHWAWVCVDGTVALLEETDRQVGELRRDPNEEMVDEK